MVEILEVLCVKKRSFESKSQQETEKHFKSHLSEWNVVQRANQLKQYHWSSGQSHEEVRLGKEGPLDFYEGYQWNCKINK